tara:strand:- start:18135 stop:19913 length:1779 start_codon:yes stop_codon:yes gene_type:complete
MFEKLNRYALIGPYANNKLETEISDVLDFIEGIASIGNSMANSKLQFEQAEATREHKEKLYERELLVRENQQTIKENIDSFEALNKSLETDIENRVKEGFGYGVTLANYAKLKGEDMTEDGWNMLEQHKENIGSNLKFSLDTFDSTSNAIVANKNKYDVQNILLNNLDGMIEDLHKAEQFRRYLGTEMMKEGIYDIADVQKLVQDIESGMFEDKDGDGMPDFMNDPNNPYAPRLGGFVGEEDIIDKTFFADKPWTKEYLMDPSFIHGRGPGDEGPSEIQKKELALKKSLRAATEEEWMRAKGFTSWEDISTKMTMGQNVISNADKLMGDWGEKGNTELQEAMGIPQGGDAFVRTFTADESKIPSSVQSHKIVESNRALKGFNLFSKGGDEFLAVDAEGNSVIGKRADALPESKVNFKRIGNLVEKYAAEKDPIKRDHIGVALTRVVYEELMPDANTSSDRIDKEFGIDLKSLEDLGIDLQSWATGYTNPFAGVGYPSVNTEEWDSNPKNMFRSVFVRMAQVHSGLIVGIGNEMDASNKYYDMANQFTFDIGAQAPGNINVQGVNAALDTLDLRVPKMNKDDDILNIIGGMNK